MIKRCLILWHYRKSTRHLSHWKTWCGKSCKVWIPTRQRVQTRSQPNSWKRWLILWHQHLLGSSRHPSTKDKLPSSVFDLHLLQGGRAHPPQPYSEILWAAWHPNRLPAWVYVNDPVPTYDNNPGLRYGHRQQHPDRRSAVWFFKSLWEGPTLEVAHLAPSLQCTKPHVQLDQ